MSDKFNQNDVVEISIAGDNDFSNNSYFFPDSKVIISYKTNDTTTGKIQVTETYYSLNRKNQKTVVSALETMGFTNIELVGVENDNKKYDKDDVISVNIAGKGDFHEGDYFFPDSKVIIEYKTNKNK